MFQQNIYKRRVASPAHPDLPKIEDPQKRSNYFNS